MEERKIKDLMIYADDDDDDNVDIISSAWCFTPAGICLSFAIRIGVMTSSDIKIYSDEFIRAVKASYKSLIRDYFYAKSDEPMVSATDRGELIMIWSFQGDDNDATKHALKTAGIKEVKYE